MFYYFISFSHCSPHLWKKRFCTFKAHHFHLSVIRALITSDLSSIELGNWSSSLPLPKKKKNLKTKQKKKAKIKTQTNKNQANKNTKGDIWVSPGSSYC